jgi:lactoylglutathione lyase
MNTITDIRNVVVNVTDHDAALRFYTQTLGFQSLVDGDTPAGRWIIVAPPGANVAISLVANAEASGIDTGIRFGTSDAAESHRQLTEHGVAVGELVAWDDMPPMFRFDDPDNNRFYVIEDQP